MNEGRYYPLLQTVDTEQARFRAGEADVVLNRTEWERIGRPVQLTVTVKEYTDGDDAPETI